VLECCGDNVLVMERMHGIPVSQIERLRAAGSDIKRLSADAVEVFFTQALRDGFFHADMHPGQHLCRRSPPYFGRWIALDSASSARFPIATRTTSRTTFSPSSSATTSGSPNCNLESGWVPAGSRVDELESAIRSVLEPIFDRPLKDIGFAQVLLRLFAASRRFNIEIQPQLVLLQKTLFNIEGLGRQLNPDLDVWQTARPVLERWDGGAGRLARIGRNFQARGRAMEPVVAAVATAAASRGRRWFGARSTIIA